MNHLYATNIFDIRRQAFLDARLTPLSDNEPVECLLERADTILAWYLRDLPGETP